METFDSITGPSSIPTDRISGACDQIITKKAFGAKVFGE
jgi:hypothetical protein